MMVATLGMSLPEVRESFSLSEVRAGGLFSTIFIVAVAASFLAGRISDKISRKTVLVTGVGLLSSGFALSGLSGNFSMMLFFMGLTGLGYGFVTPSLYALMSDLLPGRRGFGSGLVSSFYGIGGLVGPVLASFIIDRFGWRASFLTLGAIGGSITALEMIGVKSPVKVRSEQPRAASLRAVNRSLLILALAEFFGGTVFWSTASWTPTVLRAAKELTLNETGLVMGLWGGTTMIGAFLLGALSDRFGRRAVILWTAFPAAAAAFVLYYLLTSAGALAAGMLIYGTLRATVPTLVIALAQDTTSSETIGAASGTIMSMHYVAAVTAPLFAAKIISGTGDMLLAMVLTSSVPLILFGAMIASVRERKGP